jgi:hypothetical protein
VVAIILVQLVNNAATGISLRDPRFWPVNYAPVALGGLAAAVMLWWAGRARRPRRVARDPGPAGAAA